MNMIERDDRYQVHLNGEELGVFYYWSCAYSPHTLALTLKERFSNNPSPFNTSSRSLPDFLDSLFHKKETPEQQRLKELKALQAEILDEIKQLEEGIQPK